MSDTPTVTLTLTDLQALTDVAEGIMSEAGDHGVSSYADPYQVETAVINAKRAIQRVERRLGLTKPELSPFQLWQLGRQAKESAVEQPR